MPEQQHQERQPLPLGFKVLVGAAALYLAVRLIEIAVWAFGKLA